MWRGDLVGAVDPMAAIWIEEMGQAGFPLPEPDYFIALVEVGASTEAAMEWPEVRVQRQTL